LAEKKFSGSTVPSAAVGKAFADGFYIFADGFKRSANELFPVVHPSRRCRRRPPLEQEQDPLPHLPRPSSPSPQMRSASKVSIIEFTYTGDR
jgi:hypothetical protein